MNKPLSPASLINHIIDQQNILSYFQPIVNASDGRVYGYEALSRGPVGSQYHSAVDLFAAAKSVERQQQLELICIEKAVGSFRLQSLPGALFVNISPQVVMTSLEKPDQLKSFFNRLDIDFKSIVIEITEHTPVDDMSLLTNALLYFRKLGANIALDDLGTGYSSLMLWSEIKPDYIKIDRHFIEGLDKDSNKMEFVRSIIQVARSGNARVITEGVENEGEYYQAVALGADYVQGYYIQRPSPRPGQAKTRIRTRSNESAATKVAGSQYLAANLVSSTRVTEPATGILEVAALFRKDPSISSVAVVEQGKPMGIVQRHALLNELARPYGMDLHAKHPISSLMDCSPLLVDADWRLHQVSRLVTSRARLYKDDDFIIVRQQNFIGIAQVIDLLRQITELQLQTARHANPLTMLPGNIPINDCVKSLLAENRPFIFCYFDVDHFKPFNDVYGYSKGDEALLMLAQLLQSHSTVSGDFIGHIGGDDFVGIFQSDSWMEQVADVMNIFSRQILNFYSDHHQDSQGFYAKDRYGQQRFHPFLSLSVCAIEVSEAVGSSRI